MGNGILDPLSRNEIKINNSFWDKFKHFPIKDTTTKEIKKKIAEGMGVNVGEKRFAFGIYKKNCTTW